MSAWLWSGRRGPLTLALSPAGARMDRSLLHRRPLTLALWGHAVASSAVIPTGGRNLSPRPRDSSSASRLLGMTTEIGSGMTAEVGSGMTTEIGSPPPPLPFDPSQEGLRAGSGQEGGRGDGRKGRGAPTGARVLRPGGGG